MKSEESVTQILLQEFHVFNEPAEIIPAKYLKGPCYATWAHLQQQPFYILMDGCIKHAFILSPQWDSSCSISEKS